MVLLKGRNGKISFALPMPVVGSCITGLFAAVASVSFEVLSEKGITGLSVFDMLITPYSCLVRHNGALRLIRLD